MPKPLYRFIQSMLALGLAAVLAEKWISGRLSYYINARFFPLTIFAILALAGMAIAGFWSLFSETHTVEDGEGSGTSKKIPRQFTGADGETVSAGALFFLAIPLLMAVFIQPQALSTDSIEMRGLNLSVPLSINQQTVVDMKVTPDDRTLMDWIKIFNYESDLSSYLGQEANLVGFVYHDARLAPGQFMVSRFAVTCCVADAFAVGITVDYGASANLKENTWVNVKGTLDVITVAGRNTPLIHATEVLPIEAPENPYLYP